MHIAIIGSRNFADKTLAYKYLSRYVGSECEAIVSGGAKGADSIGADFARSQGIPLIEHKPDWDLYGKRAGFLRNAKIIDDCDMVIAFWDAESKGTMHSLNLAKKAKKPTLVVYF